MSVLTDSLKSESQPLGSRLCLGLWNACTVHLEDHSQGGKVISCGKTPRSSEFKGDFAPGVLGNTAAAGSLVGRGQGQGLLCVDYCPVSLPPTGPEATSSGALTCLHRWWLG